MNRMGCFQGGCADEALRSGNDHEIILFKSYDYEKVSKLGGMEVGGTLWVGV